MNACCIGAVVGNSERETAVDPPAVEQDRAGTTLAVVAPLLRAGVPEALAEGIEQRGTRIDRKPMLAAVNTQGDLYLHSASLLGAFTSPTSPGTTADTP
jgi:hypothetical protein